jgi:hypothetical protein
LGLYFEKIESVGFSDRLDIYFEKVFLGDGRKHRSEICRMNM